MACWCRLLPNACVLMGPPCSLWIFLSSSLHKRSLWNTWGDCTQRCVRMSNQIVRNVVPRPGLEHYSITCCLEKQTYEDIIWHNNFLMTCLEMLGTVGVKIAMCTRYASCGFCGLCVPMSELFSNNLQFRGCSRFPYSRSSCEAKGCRKRWLIWAIGAPQF